MQYWMLGFVFFSASAFGKTQPFAMATVFDHAGHALTVRHFIEDCGSFVALTHEHSVHQARVVRLDSGSDMVLIKIDDINKVSSRVFKSAQKARYWVLQQQGAAELPLSLIQREGDVAVAPKETNQALYDHFTGQVELGDSGAGLLGSDGSWLGMIVAKIVSPPYGGLLIKRGVIQAYLRKVNLAKPTRFLPVALGCIA